jgi:hypothetical protein
MPWFYVKQFFPYFSNDLAYCNAAVVFVNLKVAGSVPDLRHDLIASNYFDVPTYW